MRCPLCFSEKCNVYGIRDDVIQIECIGYDTSVEIHFNGLSDESSSYQKIINLVCEHIVRKPKTSDDKFWIFHYDTYEKEYSQSNEVNLYSMLKNYPESVTDITNRTLLNLSHKFKSFGDIVYVSYQNSNLFFTTTSESNRFDQAEGVLKILTQMGYLMHSGSGNDNYIISAEGWKKIETLQKEQIEIKQGFVAMRFGVETKHIRESFREAIISAGYIMRAIDEKEHNNQIVPEIFYEIQRSKFVVVDVTYPNYGAYYEAGYAQGLGKQVIVCCSREAFENKEGKFERPHFDISQKSMVIWDDLDDLKVRLKKRIEATVV